MASFVSNDFHKKAINNLAFLGIDMINKANSGHPGIVLGASSILYTLYIKHMNVSPLEPTWFNRDRFVLSAGHGSALLYSMLHLCGYKVSLEDLKRFRDIGNTPGHPEYLVTPGVDATTGPLGQGIGNAVGMAISERFLATKFNKKDFNLIDHYTYVLCGDGDLQEGVALEAISLAGKLKLNKLILLFDSNDIQLDGKTSLATIDNHKQRFLASGWNYMLVNSGDNYLEISNKLAKAKKSDKPVCIEVKTIIGKGSLFENTAKVHGSPLKEEDIVQLKNNCNYSLEKFFVYDDVAEYFRKKVLTKGKTLFKQYSILLRNYNIHYPELYKDLEAFINSPNNHYPVDNFDDIINLPANSTRNVMGIVIDKYSKIFKNIIGGSADLTSSTKAKGADGHFSFENPSGRNINYGVREHAMGAISNGIAYHTGLMSFTATFFVFSDYMKPAIRVSALSKLNNLFIFTHDSIAVSEDGPTHQPIEQLTSLRSIPNHNVIRPCDTKETIGAFRLWFEQNNTYPTSIILTRQEVKNQTNSILDISNGAYIISPEDKNKKLDLIIVSSGSEVDLCLETKKLLSFKYNIRVISMPSMFCFEKMDLTYQNSILSDRNITLAVEMGTMEMWYKYAKFVYGISNFGESTSLSKVLDHFGFTKEKLCGEIERILN